MGTPDQDNIICGNVVVYVAPTSEALPELDDITPPGVTVTPAGNWEREGTTQEDQDLGYTPKYEKVYANETDGPVAIQRVQEDASFSYNLLEKDMAAYAAAIDGAAVSETAAAADQTAQDAVGVGDTTSAYKSLLLLGTNPEGGSRIVHIHRAKRTGAVSFKTGKKTVNRRCKSWTVSWIRRSGPRDR